jgi:ApbE superfamily uncharacterized protein (UPF0280 family)
MVSGFVRGFPSPAVAAVAADMADMADAASTRIVNTASPGRANMRCGIVMVLDS